MAIAIAIVLACLLGFEVCLRGSVQGVDAGALFGREAAEVLLVVVRVVPDRTWRVDGGVDEELVLLSRVVLAHPSGR